MASLSAALMAAPALAQPPADDAASSDAEIVVTGTRIARPDLAASSPVVAIDASQLRVNNSVTAEQLLSVNPQFSPSFTSATNNGNPGAATIDLRGLSSGRTPAAPRTLVLVDGKRLAPYDSSGSTDVNVIPTALVKRVDVLTGGASAVYGSDAIAGVVNFVMDYDFTGLRLDAGNQLTGDKDGAQRDVSLTGGIKLGDRGHLIASLNYTSREAVYQDARGYSAQVLNSSDLSAGGSTNTTPTLIVNSFNPSYTQSYFQASGNNLNPTDNPILYNYNPANYLQVPLERWSATLLGKYDVSDGVEAFVRANYTQTKVTAILAPTATAGFTFDIHPDNPLLSNQVRSILFAPGNTFNNDGSVTVSIKRRITESGGRIENFDTKYWQVVGGLRGSIGAYKWEVFAQYAESKKHEDLLNDITYSNVAQALDAVAVPGGGVACRDPSNGCVPLNLFTTTQITPAQLAFISANGLEDDNTSQFVIGGNVTGDLGFLKSPWAAKPAAFAVGVEYRRETAASLVDANYASGNLIYYGQGQSIPQDSYDVKEAYFELRAPLIDGKPFIYALNLEAGYRYSEYSKSGGVSAYKGGADWSPMNGLRLRGMYERAVRAPDLYELNSPVVTSTDNLNGDPCSGAVDANSALGQLCLATGVPANILGRLGDVNAGQVNVLLGGNRNLKPEKADTWTVGLVFNPPTIRSLAVSVDYYDITVKDAINAFGGSVANIINNCYNVFKSATNQFCQAVRRDRVTGRLDGNVGVGVSEQLANIAAIKTRGIDVTASYKLPLGRSSIGLDVAGTYLLNFDVQGDPNVAAVTCAGRFGVACNLNPLPEWKHVATLNWTIADTSLLLRWRYVGPVREDVGTDILVTRIPSYSYFDLTAVQAINDQFELRVGVQNMFGIDPPVVGGDAGGTAFNAANTFPQAYDSLGRTFFINVTAKL